MEYVFYLTLLTPICLFPMMYCLGIIKKDICIIFTLSFFISGIVYSFTLSEFCGALCICIGMPLTAVLKFLIVLVKKNKPGPYVSEGIVISEPYGGKVFVFDGKNVVSILHAQSEKWEKGSVVKISIDSF